MAILEARIELAEDPDERWEMLAEVAGLHEQRGGDRSLAFHAWARALLAVPEREDGRAALKRLGAVDDAWDEVVVAYERAEGRSTDARNNAELLTDIAEIHDQRRGDPRAAIKAYERLLEVDPESETALAALEALHTMLAHWDGLIGVLRQRIERSYEAEERTELYRRIGGVQEELLGDADAAVHSYRAALDEDPSCPDALEALERLLEGQQDYAALAEILERRIEVVTDAALQMSLSMRLGEVNVTHLGLPDAAADAFERAVELAADPVPALRPLVQLYGRERRFEDLAHTLQRLLDVDSQTESRLAVQQRLAEVQEQHLDDLPAAIAGYSQVLSLQAGHEGALQGLLRIVAFPEFRQVAAGIVMPVLERLERWDALIEVLEALVEVAVDVEERKNGLRRIATVQQAHRRDAAAGFAALARALQEDAADADVLAALKQSAAEAGCWDALVQVLETQAGQCLDPDLSRALWVQAAELSLDPLADLERAAAAYLKALDQVGEDADLLGALSAVYERAQQWSKLAELLERRAQVADQPQERAAHWLALAELRQGPLDDAAAALNALQEVLEQVPGQAQAIAQLEAMLQGPLVFDAADVLEHSFRTAGDMQRVAQLFVRRAEVADTVSARLRLWQDLAQLQENELQDPAAAMQTLMQAAAVDPRDGLLWDELERLADRAGQMAALAAWAETLHTLAQDDPALWRDLNLRMAHWQQHILHDLEGAEAALRRALAADAQAAAAHEQLVELLQSQDRPQALYDALRAHAAAVGDEWRRLDLMRRAAAVAYETLDDVEAASDCYQTLLAADGGDAEALERLCALRLRQERHKEAAVLLQQRIDTALDPEARTALRRTLVEVQLTHLEARTQAVQVLEDLLAEEPDDAASMAQLSTLYIEIEAWPALRDLLERRLERAEHEAERIDIRVQLAGLMERSLGQRAEAIAQLEEILYIDGSHAAALAELERLLRAEAQWGRVADVLETQAACAAERGDAQEALDKRWARVEVLQAHGPDAATLVDALEQVLAAAPTHIPALEALLIQHTQDDYAEGMALTLARLAELSTGAEQASRFLRLAELSQTRLHDDERVEQALMRALEACPEDAAIHARIVEHFTTAGRQAELAALLTETIARIADPGVQVALLSQQAALYRDALADPAAALACLEQASALAPDDRSLLIPLCDAYTEAGRPEDAVPLLERIIASYKGRR
ncbi:MAG: tetratricopeptide repeat protein, partial [Polyangiales bacterium]